MRAVERRVGRLTTALGTSGPPPVVVAFKDGNGLLHDPLTGAPLVPPPGALLMVFTERSDGPQ